MDIIPVPMEKSNFDSLLQRYLAGQLSEPEKIKFEVWLDVVKTTYKADLVLSKQDEDRLFSKITSKVDGIAEIKNFRPNNQKTRSLSHRTWFRVAATLLLVLASSFVIWYVTGTNQGRYEVVAAVENEKHILNDGTLIWLQKGSTLSYTEKAGERLRHVELTGEALFEVAKDPQHPFTIACGDIMIQVLGTSFRVKTGRTNVELNVLTGKVNLTSPADKRGVDVSPFERVIYSTTGTAEKQTMDAQDVSALTAATEYNMQFNDATMDHVTARIAKKFNVDLKVENQQLYRCHLTADFTDNSLDVTLQMLSELLDVTYKINKNVVTLSGSGCN